MSKLEYKRLLVKFSGEAVAGKESQGIDPKILNNMANSVKLCKDLGTEISIVIGGGNLFRGEKLSKRIFRFLAQKGTFPRYYFALNR